MKIVLDSSSLILLAKTGMLGIVTGHFECEITEDVKRESTHKKDCMGAKAIIKLIEDKKIEIRRINPKRDVEIEFRLGKGEATSIALALEENKILATDDKAAINACKILGVEFITAIDFVLKAYKKGEISHEEAKNKIMNLDKYGRYSTEIINRALEKIGDKNEQSNKSKT